MTSLKTSAIKRPPRSILSPADLRQCDPSLRLEVELLVLDYLVYNATEYMLDHLHRPIPLPRVDEANGRAPAKDGRAEKVLQQLHIVDCHVTMFKTAFSGDSVPSTLRFKLHLLRFVALFTLRWNSQALRLMPTILSTNSLSELRRSSHSRAEQWWDGRGRDDAEVAKDPSNQSEYFNSYAVLSSLGSQPQAELWKIVYDLRRVAQYPQTDTDCLLLDLLPLFVNLTAERADLQNTTPRQPNSKEPEQWQTTEQWLRLAASFMLHATIEHCAFAPSSSPAAPLHAFAWGSHLEPRSGDISQSETPHANLTLADATLEPASTSDIFLTAASPSWLAWSTIRACTVLHLIDGAWGPPVRGLGGCDTLLDKGPGSDEGTAYAASLCVFETAVLGFLQSLFRSVERPVLVQLEEARVDPEAGVSVDERVLDKEQTARLVNIWAARR